MNGAFRNENNSAVPNGSNSLLQTATSRCTPSPTSTCSPKPAAFGGDFNQLKRKPTNLTQMKSLENVFGHHLGQYLANNSAYLNSSQSNHFPVGSSNNLDCLANLNNLSRDFRNHLVPTSSSSLINCPPDFVRDNLKNNLHELGLFSNLSDNNNNSKPLLDKSLDVQLANDEDEMNDDEDEDDCASIDVDGADEELNGEKNDEVKFSLNSIEENIQKSLIKSLSINSDANSIKSDLKRELRSDHQPKANPKAAEEAKPLKNPTISSLSSSSSSSSTDAQYSNINSFLYPHWLLSCTQ